jgi:hypothetical protein
MDKSFEVNAECCKLFVDNDQESIKGFRGDVRPETDHPSEALGPQTQCRHEGLHGLDPLERLLGESLYELVRTGYVAFYLHDSLSLVAIGTRYASGRGDTAAYPSHDSKTLLFEQFRGFSGG